MNNFFWGEWPKHLDPPVDGVEHFDASLIKHDSLGHKILTDNLGLGQTSTGEDEESGSENDPGNGGVITPGGGGATGPTGPRGLTGSTGATGASGATGHITYVGRGMPSIPGANPGETYLDQNDGTIYTFE